jgi:hypothetical protein
MTIIRNTNLTNVGDLIFYLDAANPRSYTGSTSTWIDISGKNNHFTLFNNPALTRSITTGSYLSFNGTNQYARSTNAINFNEYSDLTIEIGYRSTSTSTQILYETTGTGGSTATGGITLLMNSNNTATASNSYVSQWQGYGSRLYTFSSQPSNLFFNSVLEHYVKGVDPTGKQTFVNNTTATYTTSTAVPIALTTTTGGLTLANTWTFVASRAGTSNFFQGDIAYIRAWGKKLDPASRITNLNATQFRQLTGFNTPSFVVVGGGGPPLYAFTTFTFTNADTTGRIGPTLATLLASYNTGVNTWLTNTAYYNVDATFRGYQLWTVPESGNYQFQVRGASSGVGGSKGAAALITATLNLNQNDKIWIICGQRGNSNTEVGEGGSWVVLSNAGAVAGSTALIVAGGAGDYSFYGSESSFQTGQSFSDAQTTDSLNAAVLNAGANNPTNPTTGNGGTITTGAGTGNVSGGGGFNSNGDFFSASNQGAGLSFFNGLYGGLYQATVFDTTTVGGGGFGGGGARNGGFGTGGGGGYTGGSSAGSSANLRRSTGGSSYVIPSATSVTRALATAGAPSATLVAGQVVVTKV